MIGRRVLSLGHGTVWHWPGLPDLDGLRGYIRGILLHAGSLLQQVEEGEMMRFPMPLVVSTILAMMALAAIPSPVRAEATHMTITFHSATMTFVTSQGPLL